MKSKNTLSQGFRIILEFSHSLQETVFAYPCKNPVFITNEILVVFFATILLNIYVTYPSKLTYTDLLHSFYVNRILT